MADGYIGEIRMFGGNFAPAGWALCNGSLLPIQGYDALFSLIGNRYGGDGVNNFALPDLRGRLPMQQSADFPLAQKLGDETVAVTVGQVPPHSHTPQAYSQSGNASEPGSAFWAGSATARYSNEAPSLAMRADAIGPAGSVQGHNNMMPFLAVTFIICLDGYYPSRP